MTKKEIELRQARDAADYEVRVLWDDANRLRAEIAQKQRLLAAVEEALPARQQRYREALNALEVFCGLEPS